MLLRTLLPLLLLSLTSALPSKEAQKELEPEAALLLATGLLNKITEGAPANVAKQSRDDEQEALEDEEDETYDFDRSVDGEDEDETDVEEENGKVEERDTEESDETGEELDDVLEEREAGKEASHKKRKCQKPRCRFLRKLLRNFKKGATYQNSENKKVVEFLGKGGYQRASRNFYKLKPKNVVKSKGKLAGTLGKKSRSVTVENNKKGATLTIAGKKRVLLLRYL